MSRRAVLRRVGGLGLAGGVARVGAPAGVAITAGGPATPDPSPAFDVVVLGGLGGSALMTAGVNAAGLVVGVAIDATGHYRAAAWAGPDPATLDDLGAPHGWALGVNASGVAVGTLAAGPGVALGSPGSLAVRWLDDRAEDLGGLGGAWAVATAVNDGGQVVGYAEDADGRQRAFLWEDGQMRGLGALDDGTSAALGIDDAGRVVGWSGEEAVAWVDGQIARLGVPGYARAKAVAAAAGRAAGWAEDAAGRRVAVRWDVDRATVLDALDPAKPEASAASINAAGLAVGVARRAPGRVPRGTTACLWGSAGVVDLKDAVALAPGQSLGAATAINDVGQIVGYGGANDPENPGLARLVGFLLTPRQSG